jgi:hypothetical protein
MPYPYSFMDIANLIHNSSFHDLPTLPHLPSPLPPLNEHRLWYNVTSSNGHGLD